MSSIAEQALGALLSGAKGAAAGSALGPVGSIAGGAIGVAMDLLPSAAHWLGADEATAQKVVQTVQAATGANTAPEQRAALAADPGMADDLRVQLAQIAAERAAEDNRALEARLSAQFADTVNARLRDVQVRQASGGRNTRSDVMLAITIIGIVSCLGIAIYGKLDGNSAIFGLVAGLVGLFSKCFADAFSFEFGSSAGSARKTELMAQRDPIPPSPGVIVPAADVQPAR